MAFNWHRQQLALCFPWAAYPPGGETIFLSQVWLAVPVSSGASAVQVMSRGRRDECGGVSGMGWEVDPVEGIDLGELRVSAWEMVAAGLIVRDVQVSLLTMKVAWMPGWSVGMRARWDDCFSSPRGFCLHCKSCCGGFSEPSFPAAVASVFSMLVLLHQSWCSTKWDV